MAKSDEEIHEEIIRQGKAILATAYSLRQGETEYPSEAYLIEPDKIIAESVIKTGQNDALILIQYKSKYSGWVMDGVRMSFETIIKGKLFCQNVSYIKEIPYEKVSHVKTPFLSSKKVLTFPIRNIKSISIKCDRIFIDEIGTFINKDGSLIQLHEFLNKKMFLK